MKLNKKIVAVNVLATLLITDSAMAGFGAKRPGARPGSSSGAGREGGGSTTSTTFTKHEATTIDAAEKASCTGDMDSSKYFPQEMFQYLSRDKGAKIDIKLKKDNRVEVVIPPTINVCGKFVPVLKQNDETKSITVLMKLVGKKPTATGEGEAKKVTYSEKSEELNYNDLVTCLEDKKLIDGEDIDHSKLKGINYTESAHEMAYKFDKKADAKKTVTLNYGYPKAFNSPDGFPMLYGPDEKAGPVGGEDCVVAEKISENTVFVNKGRDVLIEEINIACASQDVARIAELRRSIGNADALSDIAEKLRGELDIGYLNAAKSKDVKDIQSKLAELDKEIAKSATTMSEAKAREKLEEYAKLYERLDEVYINPTIARLDSVLIAKAKMKEGSPQDKAAAEEIKKLNKELETFKGTNGPVLGTVFTLARKHGAVDSLRSIESVRSKAKVFSTVTDDESIKDHRTIEEANKEHEMQMARFEKGLTDTTDKYLASKGDRSPIDRTIKERNAVSTRMMSRLIDLNKREIENEQKYCGVGMLGSVKNPVKCSEWRNGKNARINAELRRREKDNKYIAGRDEKINSMYEKYDAHQKRRIASEAEREDNYDPAAMPSDFSPNEETFNERFPNYAIMNNQQMGYNPFMYNMGGQQQMMPQQQMMMQGQQQMMPGQYQMQQPTGAWPSF